MSRIPYEERATIFVGVSSTYQLLTLVHSGLLSALVDRGHRPLLLLAHEGLREPYTVVLPGQVRTEVVRRLPPSTAETFARRAWQLRQQAGWPRWRRKRVERMQRVLTETRGRTARWYLAAARNLGSVAPVERWRFIRTSREIDDLYSRHQPKLTLLCWGGAYPPCATLFRSARRVRCPTLSFDASWDNMDELLTIPRLDRLAVWGQAMKQEAVSWHGYAPEEVVIVGALRCDFYRDPAVIPSRDECFRAVGLDPARKLITLATNRGEPSLYADTVRALLRADEQGRLAERIQVLLRVAPGADPATFGLDPDPRLVVYRAFQGRVTQASLRESVGLVHHSDVMVSVMSTLILESSFSDTPNVTLTYPALAKLYERDFVDTVLAAEGVARAADPDAVVREVDAYLRHPARHQAGRARLRDEFAGGTAMSLPRVLREVDALLSR